MPNTPQIALSNAIKATTLLNRALDDLEEHYNNVVLDRDEVLRLRQIRANNDNNRYWLERMQR